VSIRHERSGFTEGSQNGGLERSSFEGWNKVHFASGSSVFGDRMRAFVNSSVLLMCLFAACACLHAQDKPAPPPATVAAVDPELQDFIRRYFLVYPQKDAPRAMEFWSGASPNLEVRRKQIQELFASPGSISLANLVINHRDSGAANARVRVNYDLSVTSTENVSTPNVSSQVWLLECVRENGQWKLWNETDLVGALAEELLRAKSKDEREALIAKDKSLEGASLVKEVARRADALSDRGSNEQSLAGWKVAEELATEISDQKDLARILRGIGFIHYSMGDYPKALENFRKSLAMAQSLGDRKLEAAVLANIGGIYTDQGDYAAALKELAESVKVFESIGDRLGVAITMLTIGRTYLDQEKYDEAFDYLSRSLAVAEEMHDQQNVNRALLNLGVLEKHKGNLAEALKYYERSLAISRASSDRSIEALALNNIGNVYLDQNSFDEARNYYQQSLELARTLGEKDTIAMAISNRGESYRLAGNEDLALKDLQEALSLYKELGDKDGVAEFLAAVGDIYSTKGDFAKAFEDYRESLNLGRELGSQHKIAGVMVRMADAYYLQKDFAKSLESAGQAHAIGIATEDREIVWNSSTAAGKADRALNRLPESEAAFREAIMTVESLRADAAGGIEQGESFFEDKLEPYHQMVGLLVKEGQYPAALSFAERAKGRTLLDVLAHGRVEITKSMTAEERKEENELQDEIVGIQLKLQAARAEPKQDARVVDGLKDQLNKARLRYTDFRARLYTTHPDLQIDRGQFEPLSVEEAAKLLPDTRTAFLEYLVSDEATFVFVLSQGSGASTDLRVYMIAVSAKDIAAKIEEFRRQLSQRNLAFQSSAAGLFELLVKPAEAQLRGKTAVLIAPDGPLWNVPFQSLEPRSGHYLIEDLAVAYVPSFSVLREMTRVRQRNAPEGKVPAATVIAMGNPAFGSEISDRVKLTYRDDNLSPLPEAENEVRTIEEIYGRSESRVYVGKDADEERFKREAPQFRILHLATHGVFDDSSPMYSYLMLSPSPDGKDDGLLEAWEILHMDLHADLVVLSACESGRGRIGAGEGLIGLTWSFFVAGASTTVVSQWKVESLSTAELMTAFHRARQLERRKSKSPFATARALQQAEIQLLRSEQYRHPFYWAAFVAVGDVN
jgi:CHAT domain-containing protein/Tfp pilus assembly protein PilF